MRRPLLIAAIVCGLLCARPGAQDASVLRFGGDAEGGAPFMEADPNDPSRVVGFEVDIAALLAAGLGRTPRFVQVGFSNLDPAVERGDFDIGLSGIEDNAGRRARLAVTVPYYEFREVLTVRQRRRRPVPVARRSARPPRGDARGHAGGRDPRTGTCRSTASSRSSTRTTSIRTPISPSAAWTPCCSTPCWPSGVCAATRRSRTSPPTWASATTWGSSRPAIPRCAIASMRLLREAMRDGRLRGYLHAVGHVERRPAAALCAGACGGAGPV